MCALLSRKQYSGDERRRSYMIDTRRRHSRSNGCLDDSHVYETIDVHAYVEGDESELIL